MNAHHADDCGPLPPELLAAYADGELSAAECRRVEAWLAAHPEARADVEAQRRLARLFDEAVPPAPAEEQWADALARVEQRLAAPPVDRPAWRRRAAVALAAVAAAAALVALALALKGPPPRAPEDPPDATAEEAWPVVSADDVEILSMDDRDRGALVVGEPPVSEPLDMTTEDEIKVNKWPDGRGRVGRLQVSPGPGTPYVHMSVEQEPDEDP